MPCMGLKGKKKYPARWEQPVVSQQGSILEKGEASCYGEHALYKGQEW